MTRLLVLLVVLLCAAYLVARGLERLRSRLSELLIDPAASRQPGEGELVACASCGVHVPRSRALRASPSAAGTASRFYCSESCGRPARPVSLASRSGAA